MSNPRKTKKQKMLLSPNQAREFGRCPSHLLIVVFYLVTEQVVNISRTQQTTIPSFRLVGEPGKVPEDKKEVIKGIRKAMAKSMAAALKIPHFGYCDEIDVSQMAGLRKQLKEIAANRGIAFSYMPIFIKVRNISIVHV